MSVAISGKLPISFWIISIAALVWNILVLSFSMPVSMTTEANGLLPENQEVFQGNLPLWVDVVSGLAVFGGIFGSIGLLVQKSWAYYGFLASLVGILLEQFYHYFIGDTFVLLGPTWAILPTIVLIIAIYLIWYTKFCTKRGWLS